MIAIICTSHRARGRMHSALGGAKLQAYYTLDRYPSGRWKYSDNKGIYKLTPEQFEQVRNIKGVRQMKNPPNLSPCWS